MSVLVWFLIRDVPCVIAHCSALVVLIAPVELEAAIPLLCPYLVEISLFRTTFRNFPNLDFALKCMFMTIL